MCRRYIGYLQCPECHVLHRPIDMVQFCEVAGKPRVALRDDGPAKHAYYQHRGYNPKSTIFRDGRWHFSSGNGARLLPARSAFLAYKGGDNTTICDRCIWSSGKGSGNRGGGGAAMTAAAKKKARDAQWPRYIPSARDTRILDRDALEVAVSIAPRKVGALEYWRRFFRHAPMKLLRRELGKLPKCGGLHVLAPLPWEENAARE